MKSRLLLILALLLATTGIGRILAADPADPLALLGNNPKVAAAIHNRLLLLAEADAEGEHGTDASGSAEADQDDDDGPMAAPPAAASPGAPPLPPDNGLFKGRARPTVSVQ